MQLDLDIPVDGFQARSRPYGRTFRESQAMPVHRWYSYVEGFSASYLVSTLADLEEVPGSVYDPFGGAGTTLVEASKRGIPTFFAEANPFMAFVTETKVNSAQWAARNRHIATELLSEYRERLLHSSFLANASAVDVDKYDGGLLRRNFFERPHLNQLTYALDLARDLGRVEPHAGRLATLACASNIVSCSNMTRRADLRRRKPGEYSRRVVNVPLSIAASTNDILADLDGVDGGAPETSQVASDCRLAPSSCDELFELAVTSPPYLNGTNYVRNTKLELLLLGLVDDENGLGPLRHAGVTAGITQAATSRGIEHSIEAVEVIARRLDVCAADRRIPHLVRAYFSDMLVAMRAVYRTLKPNGKFILDIGDSKFYGVHVPTDRLLASIAESVGFTIERDRVIARRVSRDKTPLVQVDLVLRKPL
jgi:hypothetical protein